jgi:hypothetical protein
LSVYRVRRFPIERHAYNKKTGSLLQHRISQILRDLGFKTEIRKVEANGADLRVYNDEGNLIVVGEILNWSLRSYLNIDRKTEIINNLSEHSCRRILIYALMGNEHILEDLRLHEISTIRIGYQILPEYFYDFYAQKNQTKSRRIDSRKTTEEIRSLLHSYLRSIKPKDHSRTLSNESLVEEITRSCL